MSRRRYNWASAPSCLLYINARQSCFTSTAETTACTDGVACGRIKDLSGNGRHFDQATGANQPLWKATGLNSRPSLLFDGVNDRMLTASFTIAQACTIVVVGSLSGVGGYFCDSIAGNGRVLYGDASGLAVYGGSAFVYSGAFDCSAHTAFFGAGVFNGASSQCGVNNTMGSTGDAGSDTATTGMCLGDYGASPAGAPLFGHVAMLGVFSGTKTTAELTFLYQFAKEECGV